MQRRSIARRWQVRKRSWVRLIPIPRPACGTCHKRSRVRVVGLRPDSIKVISSSSNSNRHRRVHRRQHSRPARSRRNIDRHLPPSSSSGISGSRRKHRNSGIFRWPVRRISLLMDERYRDGGVWRVGFSKSNLYNNGSLMYYLLYMLSSLFSFIYLFFLFFFFLILLFFLCCVWSFTFCF